MKQNRRLHVLCAFLAAGILAISGAFAQSITGSLVGTVTDVSGAAVANAAITITNEETSIEYRATAGATGEYSAPNLPPGTYTVKTEVTGFKPSVVRGVRLLATRTMRVDMSLEPGALTQTVEVKAAAPVITSENATIGNVLESQVIRSLPLNGRTLDRLIRISAGVTTDSAANPRVAGSAYWGGIQFSVDGLTYNDMGNGGGAYSYRNGLATLPSVDAVSEFKMDSNSMKAEYEGSVSATVVTRSGTNEFHGSVLWFNRNKEYAAKNAFATHLAKPPFNRNEFGYTIGGPIAKNKTFFFHSFEGLRERTTRTNANMSVATAAMRNGDFSGLETLIDPLSKLPFANNQIPSSRIDPRSKALIEWVPLPNQAGRAAAGTLQNYSVIIPHISDVNRYGLRVDHRFSDKDSIWVNLNYSKGDPYFVAQGYPEKYGSWQSGGYSTQSLSFTHMHTFSPTTLNEFRYGYLRHASVRQGMNRDFDPVSLFPTLYKPAYGGLPYMSIGNHVAIGDYGGSDLTPQLTPQYVNNFTHIRGKHTIKAGVDFANNRAGSYPGTSGMGSALAGDAGLGRFNFAGRYTLGTSGTAQPAHSFADYLLGYPTSTARSTTTPNMLFYSTRYSAYAQDDWQVTPRITMTFGLRYMVQTLWKERDQTQAQFDFASGKLYVTGDKFPPAAQQALIDAYPVTTAKALGLSNSLGQTDKNNFSPRFGIAWRPFGDTKTVFRGGAGIYYNYLPVYIGFRQLGFNNPPFLLAETFEAEAGFTPSLTLASPFPGGGKLSPNPSLTAVEQNIRNSESYQWNITAEREISANLGVRASYVGNKSTHLPWYNYPINLSREQIPGPIQNNRPYQPWADVLVLAGGGDSNLHQLQLEAVQRYRGGLTFQIEYSWNRSLDNVPVVGGPQNPYNADIDRGNSDQIRRHIFSAAYGYELPFGRGKKWLNTGGVVNQILGGWQVGGITYLRTGTPFSVSFATSTQGWRGGRADVLRDPTLSRGERSQYRWFDASAFAVPAPFTWGNSARNMLFTPGDIVFDVSLLKDFSITERIRTQFRAEAFNMPNHTNLGGPGAAITTPATVGRIAGAGDPRQVQFGLKVLF